MSETREARLERALRLIECQDQGAGGTVTEAEAWRSAQQIAKRALREYAEAPPQEPPTPTREARLEQALREAADIIDGLRRGLLTPDMVTSQPARDLLTEASPEPPTPEPEMGTGWFVSVGRSGDSIVTIEERMLAGKPDLSAADRALIRGAARHLLAFAGEG